MAKAALVNINFDVRKKRPSALSLPLSIERDYQTKIRKLLIRAKDILKTNVIDLLPAIISQIEAKRPTADSVHYDDINDQVRELFNATRGIISQRITDFEINGIAQDKSLQVSNWNKERIALVFKQLVGIDIFQFDPFLSEELNLFVINNVNLIKNVTQQFIDQSEQIVFDGMRRGLRHESIAKQILGSGKDELGRVSRFKNAKTRANLIARDQVNKLNGNLTKLRQEDIGVKEYVWRTVGDERVRGAHRARNGQTFTWKKGSNTGTHPGDEIQCRCYAEPIIDSLLES